MTYTHIHEFLLKLSRRNYNSKREYDAEYKRLRIDATETQIRDVYNEIIKKGKIGQNNNSYFHMLLLYAAIMVFIYIYIREPLDLSYYSLCIYCAYELYNLPPRLDDSFKFYTVRKLGIVNTRHSYICTNNNINWDELWEEGVTRIEFVNPNSIELWKSCGGIAAINLDIQDIQENNTREYIYTQGHKYNIYSKVALKFSIIGIGIYALLYYIFGVSHSRLVFTWFAYIMRSEYNDIKIKPDEHIRYTIDNPIFSADEWNINININMNINMDMNMDMDSTALIDLLSLPNHLLFPWIQLNNGLDETEYPYINNELVVVHEYSDDAGVEYFIQSISGDRQRVYGFIRMRINKINNGTALIREIKMHRTERLMACAELIAAQNNNLWKLTLIDNGDIGRGLGFKGVDAGNGNGNGYMTKLLRQ